MSANLPTTVPPDGSDVQVRLCITIPTGVRVLVIVILTGYAPVLVR